MPASWKNRATYGKLLRRIIIRQAERFEKTTDDETAIKIATNIGYLSDKLNNLLKQEESKLAERIEKLEDVTRKKNGSCHEF
ncbi:hypothetical protein [Nitrosopumilus sp.]|uniref:hypothetical protein n=1 Tax=Nitrosopumilus sp. TaxID=2024843 RepID=UPI00247BC6E4|nr:hypothetical protein [Nitrosopumilus sp.]MCV0409386.1 hypothetical protein [Nitrosopumilus sp.]